jgi:hypothetical protein
MVHERLDDELAVERFNTDYRAAEQILILAADSSGVIL